MLPISPTQRPAALSHPVRAYLLGIGVGMVAMLCTVPILSGKFLLALALATIPQLVLGRALDWSPITDSRHARFYWRASAAQARQERPHLNALTALIVANGTGMVSTMIHSLAIGVAVFGFLYIILAAFPW